MSNSLSKIFCDALKKYAYILQRDFVEVTNVLPHKRVSFLNSGIKIFLKNVMAEMEVFNLDIDYFYDNKTSECFLDTVLAIQIFTENFEENIIFNPMKLHVFYSDNKTVFFNDKKIIPVQNTNNLQVRSINPFFIQNLYICYFFLGCFKEIIISERDLENNKYALALCAKLPHIICEKIPEGLLIKSSTIKY